MFKILVVEDDREMNRTVCTFLNQSGYETTGCLGADDAYDAMYEKMFDLIVSDIMMPQIDGFEFAQTVRSLNENIPILFMTARDDFAAKQRGYRIGVDDYMMEHRPYLRCEYLSSRCVVLRLGRRLLHDPFAMQVCGPKR